MTRKGNDITYGPRLSERRISATLNRHLFKLNNRETHYYIKCKVSTNRTHSQMKEINKNTYINNRSIFCKIEQNRKAYYEYGITINQLTEMTQLMLHETLIF